MNHYIIGALIGIFIYSLILTIITIYKDNSGYFSVDTVDVIVAGPCSWLILLFGLIIIRPIYKLVKDKKKEKGTETKEKEYKKKSSKYIQRVVKRIIKNYSTKKYHNDYFKLDKWFDDSWGNYSGYESLLVKKARNEWLNEHFLTLMYMQKEETIEELKKYMDKVTEEVMTEDKCNKFYIKKYKDEGLYKLKKYPFV